MIRRHYRAGEFELHVALNEKNIAVLQEDSLIMLGADGHKVGVIRHKELSEESNSLILKGYSLSGVIGRRITIPPANNGYDRISGTAETVLKHYINTNCISAVDSNRAIQQLILAPDLQRGNETPWQSRFENLADVCQQVAEWCDIGWEVWLDIENAKWVFDAIPGRDLSADQDALPPVIFAVEFDNIKGQQYTQSGLNLRNVGYAGGKGDEENRLILQIGSAEGLSRHEAFIDCSGAADVDELLTDGQQKLSVMDIVKSFSAQVLPGGSFAYGQDWYLGDMVTVQNRAWGITMNSRITEVKEVYEASGFSLEATFGSAVPTFIEKIKKATTLIVR